jgi:hypothetical protein
MRPVACFVERLEERLVLDAATASPQAPGTPVYSTTYDLGQSLLNNGTLSADGDSTTNINEFPWTMSFDRTTQTIWVDLRGGDDMTGGNTQGGGDRVMQIDPATGTYKLYDLQSPGLAAQHPEAPDYLLSSGPHGLFFDFETHITPRVWITQMQKGYLSYIDVAKNQLVSYNITSVLKGLGLVTGMIGNELSADTHAVVVDARGVVWFSDMSDGLLLEFDPRQGDALNTNTGMLTIHKIPQAFLDTAQGKSPIPSPMPPPPTVAGPHGIDVVVDQVTGAVTVYAAMIGDGHVLRL